MRCKCRYCQTNLDTKDAYLQMLNKQKAYFCNNEHYNLFSEKQNQVQIQKQIEKELKAAERAKKQEQEQKEKQREKELKNEEKQRRIAEELAEKQRKKEEAASERQRKIEEKEAAVEKRKQDKNKVYYLICDIVGRKEIINTVLWKEWAIWNKVADNEHIGRYLEENKSFLTSMVAKIDNNEYLRIRYLSGILKNNLGDFKKNSTVTESKRQVVQIDETFYEPVQTRNNKRRSLEDLEDEF